MRIVTVLGARPQFIKASVVSAAMRKHGGLNEIVVHTGQHFDSNMSGVFLAELGMSDPKYHLGINGGHHGEMTGRMLIEVEKVMLSVHPDVVLVYGDTNSTLAGALAAAKMYIPVAHVEVGLRSFNMCMPEEINRIVSDRLADLLFAPTDAAVANLAKEGITGARVQQVADVIYDVALFYAGKTRAESGILTRVGLQKNQYILATIHRAENTDNVDRLDAIVGGLCQVSDIVPVIWRLHPRTQKMLDGKAKGKLAKSGVKLIDPVGYLDKVMLEVNAKAIVTDSGGLQKEAFFHRVPCITLRDETEWVELVEAGWTRLAAPVSEDAVQRAIQAAVGGKGDEIAPYGQGDADQRIARCLVSSTY